MVSSLVLDNGQLNVLVTWLVLGQYGHYTVYTAQCQWPD